MNGRVRMGQALKALGTMLGNLCCIMQQIEQSLLRFSNKKVT